MEVQLRLQKTEEITYLKENTQQTRYRLTYLEDSKYDKRNVWRFQGMADIRKCKCYIFSIDKQRNKVCLVHLECKLQHDKSGYGIFKWKC